jgi:hypothetical protein
MGESASAVLDRALRMLPGPELVCALAVLDPSALSRENTYRFVALNAQNRSWQDGRELRALAAVAGPSEDSRSEAASLRCHGACE